jgi:hypothetical protein
MRPSNGMPILIFLMSIRPLQGRHPKRVVAQGMPEARFSFFLGVIAQLGAKGACTRSIKDPINTAPPRRSPD